MLAKGICHLPLQRLGFPGGTMVKNLPANAGDAGSVPELGRSPGEGNGNPLQYSCLGNPMDREAWWPTVQGSQRVRHNLATQPTHTPEMEPCVPAAVDLQHTLRQFRVESEALRAPRKLVEQVFKERFQDPNPCIYSYLKVLNPFKVTSALCD